MLDRRDDGGFLGKPAWLWSLAALLVGLVLSVTAAWLHHTAQARSERNLLDQALKEGQVSATESRIFGVVNPDDEHFIWPFDGEYWRDELGFYRQEVESACGR